MLAVLPGSHPSAVLLYPYGVEKNLREMRVGSIFLLTGRGMPAESFFLENGYGEVPAVAMAKEL